MPGWFKLDGPLLHEQLLLRLPEEEWKAFQAPILKGSGPKITGDNLVDSWERELREGTLDLEGM